MKRILYICDRKKCENCSPDCKHTTDIKHAKHFERFSDVYIENNTVQDTIENFTRSLEKIKKDIDEKDGDEK